MSAQPLENRMAHLEGAYQQIDKRFGDLTSMTDTRFGQIDARFADLTSSLNARFAELSASINAHFFEHEARLSGLDRKVDGLQWRLTSLILATWITTILAVLLRH